MSILCLVGLALTLAPAGPKLALAINVPAGGGEEAFIGAMRQQIRLGLDGSVISVKWDEYEAQNGKPLVDGVNGLKFLNQDALVTIASVDTVKRRLPPDIADKPWDDPLLRKRWIDFLVKATSQFNPRVKWVSLGNEVDGYLNQHPSELDAYLGFLAAGREAVRKARPDILVGVTVMCMDGLKEPALIRRLQEGMDVTVFTYYPMDGLTVYDPATIGPHFDFMAGIAGPRPLILQEIGYPCSEKNGSSEDKQARFVHSVFAQIDRFATKIPLAAYFIQCDFSPALLKELEPYYGLSDPRFVSFLSSLGLSDSAGKPRLAWTAFKEELVRRKPF